VLVVVCFRPCSSTYSWFVIEQNGIPASVVQEHCSSKSSGSAADDYNVGSMFDSTLRFNPTMLMIADVTMWVLVLLSAYIGMY
jgi:hypothetical protein